MGFEGYKILFGNRLSLIAHTIHQVEILHYGQRKWRMRGIEAVKVFAGGPDVDMRELNIIYIIRRCAGAVLWAAPLGRYRTLRA
jgi:hypothetical protein